MWGVLIRAVHILEWPNLEFCSIRTFPKIMATVYRWPRILSSLPTPFFPHLILFFNTDPFKTVKWDLFHSAVAAWSVLQLPFFSKPSLFQQDSGVCLRLTSVSYCVASLCLMTGLRSYADQSIKLQRSPPHVSVPHLQAYLQTWTWADFLYS